VLDVQNVTKRFAGKVAVDSVSFRVEPGRIFGLLGPNGAGKTTTLRMIAAIFHPDDGSIHYSGRPVGAWSQAVMGYLPEERGLYRKMKVGEQLVYLSRLKGLGGRDARSAVRTWLERFEAGDWFDKKVEELSKGMQQKVQFVATVVHDPSLYIFDEPFSGLDPINAELLQDVILELKSRGKTILFASHRMEQVEQICDDICLVSDGRTVLSGGVREVKRSFGRNVVNLGFDGQPDFLREMESSGAIRVVHIGPHHAEIRLLGGTDPRAILETALDRLEDVYRYEVVEPSLNEIFISVVSGVRDEAEVRESGHNA